MSGDTIKTCRKSKTYRAWHKHKPSISWNSYILRNIFGREASKIKTEIIRGRKSKQIQVIRVERTIRRVEGICTREREDVCEIKLL